jgi:hypothetical protein
MSKEAYVNFTIVGSMHSPLTFVVSVRLWREVKIRSGVWWSRYRGTIQPTRPAERVPPPNIKGSPLEANPIRSATTKQAHHSRKYPWLCHRQKETATVQNCVDSRSFQRIWTDYLADWTNFSMVSSHSVGVKIMLRVFKLQTVVAKVEFTKFNYQS